MSDIREVVQTWLKRHETGKALEAVVDDLRAALASVPAVDAGDREPASEVVSEIIRGPKNGEDCPLCDAIEDKQCLYHRGYSDGCDAVAVRREPASDPLTLAEQQMCPNCITPWKCNGPHTEPASEVQP